MSKIFNFFRFFNYMEWLLILFPICIVFGSAPLNFMLILCSIISLSIIKKNFNKIKKNYWIFFYLIFFFYLVLNSFFSIDFTNSFQNSLSQIRFILFVIFIYYAVHNIKNLYKILFLYSLIILFVSADTIFQFLNYGEDLFGIKTSGNSINRYSGPFGDELVVGAYISILSIPILSLYLCNYKNFYIKMKCYIIIFLFIIFFAVILSGERMNILIFITTLLIIFLINFNYKKNIIFILFLSSLLFITYKNINSFHDRANSLFKEISYLKLNNHVRVFSGAYNVWKQNKITGVGNKNYRIVCDEKEYDAFTKTSQLCSTHPHNLYFELLSETGLAGFILFIIFIITFFINYFNPKTKFNKSTYPIFFGCFLVILFYLWPIRSNGSFFSTFTGSFFWLNIGYLLLVKRLNEK